jgi:hypothetical protein
MIMLWYGGFVCSTVISGCAGTQSLSGFLVDMVLHTPGRGPTSYQMSHPFMDHVSKCQL